MSRSKALQLYIWTIGIATALVLLVSFAAAYHLGKHTLDYVPALLLFIGLSVFANRRQIYVQETNTISMGSVAHGALLVVFPFPFPVLGIALAKLLSESSLRIQRQRRKSWRAVVVNTGASVLAAMVSGGIFTILHGQSLLWSGGLYPMIALATLVLLAITYYICDAFVVGGAISLSNNDSYSSIVNTLVDQVFRAELALIVIGFGFAVVWHYNPVLVLLLVVPMLIGASAFDSIARLRRETMEAVLKMAESIDYRDTGTYEHSRRLADMSRRLAVTLGITPEHVNEVVLASRVHDLGKIGISNDILFKQGPLSPEERTAMEEHPVIGANILSSYSAFQSSVSVVRHHHERWDGKGYPAGLKGEDIPLGSRIIAVVDSYDAMTADRPYRKGMPPSAAVERLKDGMGTQFDPRVCATFIQILIEEGVYIPSEPVRNLHIITPDGKRESAYVAPRTAG